MRNKEWLAGSKEGLRQLVGDRGKAFVFAELIQNAWDEDGVTEVSIWIESVPSKSKARISVEDDGPEGWVTVEDMFTLFNPSKKKKDPNKRGRWNLGEKLVLAVCDWAEIISMNCAMVFDESGRRASKKRRDMGTAFTAIIPLTRAEKSEIEMYIETLIPPPGIRTTFQGAALAQREPVKVFNVALPTVFENAEGQFRNTTRKTDVQIFEVGPDETPHIYEMGIPVVETDIKWHVNVLQKVPLNMNRDNVPPRFYKTICTEVMNQMVRELEQKDTSEVWVYEAIENPDIEDGAIVEYMDKRFGKKRVQYDLNDLEANKRAVSEGYTVVYSNSLSKAQRANVKRANALLPAGQVTPSISATFHSTGTDVTVPASKWSAGMKEIVEWAETLAQDLLGASINVGIVNDPRNYSACYSRENGLLLNMRRLGRKWFRPGPSDKVLELLIHEFGHHYASDHLSDEYHDALCRLAARVANVACAAPQRFEGVFGRNP